MDTCCLCSNDRAQVDDSDDHAPFKLLVRCDRCGTYYAFEGQETTLERLDNRHLLSGLACEKNEMAKARRNRQYTQKDSLLTVDASDEELRTLFAQVPNNFDIAAKVRKLLQAVARASRQPGDIVDIESEKDYPLAYARDTKEMSYLFNYAVDMGWLTSELEAMHDADMRCRLTPLGWEEIQTPVRVDSTTVFVAMWFDDSLTPAYTDAIKQAIEDDCRYRAIRVDLEDTNNDDIVDEILAQIRASRFVVADLTGHRHGVYFEAGFAKGLGIPVIWTCQREDFEEHRTFDTEHYNHIVWDDPAELREKLANRIKASIGVGPLELHSEQ